MDKKVDSLESFLRENFSPTEIYNMFDIFAEQYNKLAFLFPSNISVTFSSIKRQLDLYVGSFEFCSITSEGIKFLFQYSDSSNETVISPEDIEKNYENYHEKTKEYINSLSDSQMVEPIKEHSHEIVSYISSKIEKPLYDISPFREKINEKDYSTKKNKLEENSKLELKSSLRIPIGSNSSEHSLKRMQELIKFSSLKVLVGMLNGSGGTLIIGVDNSGKALGLDNDFEDITKGKKERDGKDFYEVWVSGTLLPKELGPDVLGYIKINYVNIDSKTCLELEVHPSKTPVYMYPKSCYDPGGKGEIRKKEERTSFYLRAGTSTSELVEPYLSNYISNNFPTRGAYRKGLDNTRWSKKGIQELFKSISNSTGDFFSLLEKLEEKKYIFTSIANLSEGIIEVKMKSKVDRYKSYSIFSISTNYYLEVNMRELSKMRYFKKNRTRQELLTELNNIFGGSLELSSDPMNGFIQLSFDLFENKENSEAFFNFINNLCSRINKWEGMIKQ